MFKKIDPADSDSGLLANVDTSGADLIVVGNSAHIVNKRDLNCSRKDRKLQRNNFPRNSRVKLLMCDDPACQCGMKYAPGEEGIVARSGRRIIVVECSQKFEGLMTRVIGFHREAAETHLERVAHARTPA